MQPSNNVAQLTLTTYYPYFPTPTPIVYNENDMDDETIPISNCSNQFDNITKETSVLTDNTSMESEAPPILTTTKPLESRHIIWK